MDVAVGGARIVSVVPETTATTAPLVNVTSTDDAAAGVPTPITTTAVVSLIIVQFAAAVPELGTAPTRALQ